MANRLGIDVRTKDVRRLINRLKRLNSTKSVEDGGAYREDEVWSQVRIETTKDEAALDEWLYKTAHGCDYIGVFTR